MSDTREVWPFAIQLDVPDEETSDIQPLTTSNIQFLSNISLGAFTVANSQGIAYQSSCQGDVLIYGTMSDTQRVLIGPINSNGPAMMTVSGSNVELQDLVVANQAIFNTGIAATSIAATNLTISGNLSLTKSSSMQGPVTIWDIVNCKDDLVVNQDLTVQGNATMSNGLSLYGSCVVGSNLNVGGLGIFDANIKVLGSSAIGGWSIYAEESIIARQYDVISDERVKTNIQSVQPKDALALINKLDVCTYQLLSRKMSSSQSLTFGMKAQQIEKILPGCVKTISEVIPLEDEIPVVVSSVDAADSFVVSVNKSFECKIGDTLACIDDNFKQYHCRVLESDENQLRLQTESNQVLVKDSTIKITGKYIEDFRVMNYEQIVALCISAIQELSRQISLVKNTNENI